MQLGSNILVRQEPAWQEYRHKMRQFIINKIIEGMSEEEMLASVRSSLNTRYFYSPDEKLMSLYKKYGGTDESSTDGA